MGGCVSSKIQHEDAVGQCEARKSFVKQAVVARTALAVAQARYVQSLAATSLAFKQFSDSELGFRSSSGEGLDHREEEIQQQPKVDLVASPAAAAKNKEDRDGGGDHDQEQEADRSSPVSISPTSSEEIMERESRIKAMMLRNTPNEAVTVVMSPPRRRSFTSENDYFTQFMGEDNKEGDEQEQRRRGGTGGAAEEERHHRHAATPPPPTAPSTWEYFNIFHPPTPLVGRFKDIPSEDDEDIPSLESSDDEELRKVEKDGGGHGDGGDGAAPPPPKIEEIFEQVNDAASSSGDSSGDGASSRSTTGGGGDGVDGVGEAEAARENAAAASGTPAAVELVDVLRELEEQFLRASEAGKAVSRMLEAGKILERGFSDHSSRLLSALSLGHWSPRSLSSPLDIEAGGMSGSHAGTLDRLYAWEKKLYEEVKAWESVNTELERKRKLLRNLDARGAKADVIDKTRASMKALETEITVAVHGMEASSASIQKITDDEMLPQLLELLEGLAIMWKCMHECHQQQLRVVMHLKLPQDSSLEAISVSHRNTTAQLELALTSWQTSLGGFISMQKDYVRSLSGWIKWSVPQESGTKKSGKKAVIVPKIRFMCDKWAEALEKLPLHAVSNRMKELSETLREIGSKQAEEIRLQRRTEALSKELNKKMISLNSMEKKQQAEAGTIGKKKSSVEKLEERVEMEKQRFRAAIRDTRSFTLCGLQSSLPPLFQEVQSFSEKCAETHTVLYEEVSSYTAGSTTEHPR